MKTILYFISSLFIIGPIVVWIIAKMNMPKDFPEQENADFVYHDFYMNIGSLTSSPKTFAFISLAIGFLLLACITHLDYKKTHSSETTEELTGKP